MNRSVFGVGLIAATMVGPAQCSGDETSPARPPAVDATTLRHKVLCGYQGWFRCPGDPAGEGWRHWGRDRRKLTPYTLTVEMWPDLSDFPADQTYPAPGFTHPDGSPARLFSSADPKTVERHFEWMQQYGIDGVFAQRFLVELGGPSTDRVLGHVRASAAKAGRVYAVCYDLTGTRADKLYDLLVADWKRLVDDLKITQDDRYLRHGGKPVVFVWGFFSDRFGPRLAHRVIDFFKADGRHAAALVGGCPWRWRGEADAEWARAFRRFDVLSPWNVGNVAEAGGRKHAATGSWKDDLAEAKKVGMGYLPVVYPGFGWTNLKGRAAAGATIPRLGGEFFWRQFVAAADLGVDMAYVAMFDEVDEGTAVFKVTNAPPKEARFTTYDGLPSDWYLRLTGEGAKVIRGERKPQAELPIKP
ncbi:MAG TPA: glycoside hydrolase family 71/99-like protein [Gemmataceae bacterium]|nr:glycoside hydrolase family 71/99-like protein [Gemmataceae bacterium]